MLTFTVHGKPQPGGSKRAFIMKGRAIVTDANARAKPWQAVVADKALDAIAEANEFRPVAWESPLALTLTFHVPRPAGHYGKRGLRPSAPEYPAVRPDVLKLARAVEDALTGIVWRDDAQIVRELLIKQYGEPTRVEILVERA